MLTALIKKEAAKALNFSALKMKIMDWIFDIKGHELPNVKMNKRKRALRQLHFLRIVQPDFSCSSFLFG